MTAVLVAAGAFLMTLIGGFVAQRTGDRRHLVLGFAAGLMLGVVAFDLLPEAMRQAPDEVHGVPQALLMFAVGFLTIHVVERAVAIHRATRASTPSTPTATSTRTPTTPGARASA